MADEKREMEVENAVRLVSGPPEELYDALHPKDIIEMQHYMPLPPWKDIGASNNGFEVRDGKLKIQITERPAFQAYEGEWLDYGAEMGLCALWWPRNIKDIQFHYFPLVRLDSIVNQVEYRFKIELYDQSELWRRAFIDTLEHTNGLYIANFITQNDWGQI